MPHVLLVFLITRILDGSHWRRNLGVVNGNPLARTPRHDITCRRHVEKNDELDVRWVSLRSSFILTFLCSPPEPVKVVCQVGCYFDCV
jgi:hypothetical protein